MTDARAGGANDLRQLFLIDSGMDPGQALLAEVEKLADQILFKASAASEMMSAKNPMFREKLKANSFNGVIVPLAAKGLRTYQFCYGGMQ